MRAAADSESFAMICIDLDRFKEVNDVFGHSRRRRACCCEVARRLQAVAGRRFPGAARRRRVHADRRRRSAAGERGRAGDRSARRSRRRYRDRRPPAAHRAQHRGCDLSGRRHRRDRRCWQRRRRALSRQGRRPRHDPLLRAGHGQAAARAPRAAARSALGARRAASSSLHYQPQASDRRRDHRFRGAGALAPSDPRAGPAGRLHPAGRGKRPDHADRRMGVARGVPRGGVLAEAAADRGQPVAGPVPPRRSARGWCIRSC